MKMRHLINLLEDQPTSGALPAQDLVKLLPDVSDITMFTSALAKIQNGQENMLSPTEKAQLANAFISIIKAEDVKKTAIIQKMMPVTAQTTNPAQATQSS